jgi:hypothetical protein
VLINHAEKANNCSAVRKFRSLELNVKSWKLLNEKLINVGVAQKIFNEP